MALDEFDLKHKERVGMRTLIPNKTTLDKLAFKHVSCPNEFLLQALSTIS